MTIKRLYAVEIFDQYRLPLPDVIYGQVFYHGQPFMMPEKLFLLFYRGNRG